MDQAQRVGGGQAPGDLLADPQDLRHLQRPGAVDVLLQGLARDEFHHQIRQRVHFAHRMDGHDMLMADRRRRLGFPQETLVGVGIRSQLRRQHFDRDHAVQPDVVPAQNDPHSAPPQDLGDLVQADSPQPARLVTRLEKRQ